MLYRNYIFDLYGTLADILTDEEKPSLWRTAAEHYSLFGAKYGAEELKCEYLSLCSREQAQSPEPLYEIELRNVFAALFSRKGVTPDENLVERTAVLFREASTLKLRLYPWVIPVLERIRRGGSGLFLLSNAQACFTIYELEKLGISGLFDGIVLSSDIGLKKPHPGIMTALLERYGLSPSECLMTGNDRSADIAVAKAFSMPSLYIRTETSFEEEGQPRGDIELLDGDFSKLPALLKL